MAPSQDPMLANCTKCRVQYHRHQAGATPTHCGVCRDLFLDIIPHLFHPPMGVSLTPQQQKQYLDAAVLQQHLPREQQQLWWERQRDEWQRQAAFRQQDRVDRLRQELERLERPVQMATTTRRFTRVAYPQPTAPRPRNRANNSNNNNNDDDLEESTEEAWRAAKRTNGDNSSKKT